MIINIEDVNDNLAEFADSNLNLTLPEHPQNGLEVIKMNATDKDKVPLIRFQVLALGTVAKLLENDDPTGFRLLSSNPSRLANGRITGNNHSGRSNF